MARAAAILSSNIGYCFFQVIFSAALLLLAYIFIVTPASNVGRIANQDIRLVHSSDKLAQTGDPLTQYNVKSPETKAKSPQTKAQSPQTKAKSPQTKAKSPQTKAKSPQTKAKSPQTEGKLPLRVNRLNNIVKKLVQRKGNLLKPTKKLTGIADKNSPEALLSANKHKSRATTFEIPHILHHTFASEMVYENYRPMINSCLALNPNWTYYLWRDSDARALIAKDYPQYLKTYLSFKDNLQRSDAIRYVILHRFGGIYADMDVECVKPFHPALTKQAAFIDQERLEQTRILWQKEFSAMNSLMGSIPGHEFYRFMADRAFAKSNADSAFHTTGPFALTKAFEEYRNSPTALSWPVTLLPPSVASPMMDGQKDWKSRCQKLDISNLSWLDVGCSMLQASSWSLGSIDKSTVAVHWFLHLGYNSHKRNRRSLFNVTKNFSNRVKFYL